MCKHDKKCIQYVNDGELKLREFIVIPMIKLSRLIKFILSYNIHSGILFNRRNVFQFDVS